jgi:2-polyprenyl-3-methyl-5-hydroxy-6-metoxy-1,4-benzoquinol methylase
MFRNCGLINLLRCSISTLKVGPIGGQWRRTSPIGIPLATCTHRTDDLSPVPRERVHRDFVASGNHSMRLSETSLHARRKAAAEASAGISADFLYDKYEEIIRERHLSGSVLDFGAGQGFLTRRLIHMNLFSSVAAVDILPKPFAMPPKVHWIDADLNESLAEPDESFDVILCCEVIQCLENPRAVAREFFRLLRSSGTVIISTPNNESVRAIGALWIRGHFVDFGESAYPFHKTALLKMDLDRLLGEAGFERPEFLYSNHGGLPKKPSATWQRMSGGWLVGKRFSDNIFAIARKASRSPL